MDTFQKLRRRLRQAPPHPATLVLDDLLAEMSKRESDCEACEEARHINAGTSDATAVCVAHGDPLDPDWLRVASDRCRESGAAERMTAVLNEQAALRSPTGVPVLPPGCRMVPNGPSGAVIVWGRHGRFLCHGVDAETGAASAWQDFGAFMSREDYEQHAADFRDLRTREADARARIAAAEQDLRRALERCSIRVPDGLGAMASELALTVERLRESLAERTRLHTAALDAFSDAEREIDSLRDRVERKPWHANALCFAGIQGRRYALVEVMELDPAERKRLLADPRRMGGESLDEFRVRLAAQGGG